jgi:hypothetical protein
VDVPSLRLIIDALAGEGGHTGKNAPGWLAPASRYGLTVQRKNRLIWSAKNPADLSGSVIVTLSFKTRFHHLIYLAS